MLVVCDIPMFRKPSYVKAALCHLGIRARDCKILGYMVSDWNVEMDCHDDENGMSRMYTTHVFDEYGDEISLSDLAGILYRRTRVDISPNHLHPDNPDIQLLNKCGVVFEPMISCPLKVVEGLLSWCK